MDEPTIYRLYIAREIMREGIEAAQEPLPVSRMRSLLALDQAVELALRTTLPLIGETPKREDRFSQLLDSLLKRKPGLASHRTDVAGVHDQRNDVQHAGRIPSPEEARIAAVVVEGFLRALVRDTVGKSLEELSPLSLIEDEDARERLRKAEEHLQNEQWQDACREATIAFHVGTGRALRRIFSASRMDISGGILRRLFNEIGQAAKKAALHVQPRGFEEFAEAFEHALQDRNFFARDIFEPLEKLLLFSSFGIPPSDLRRFEDVAPRVNLTASGKHEVLFGQPPIPETAAYVLDFAVRAILRLESWARR